MTKRLLLTFAITLVGSWAVAPTPAAGQNCWTCQFTPPSELQCVGGTSGQECQITCSQSKCRCRATIACKVGLADEPCPPSPEGVLRSDTIDWSPAGPIVASSVPTSVPIALQPGKLDAIAATSGLLGLTLDLAHQAGRLEADIVTDGMYLDRAVDGSVKEVHGYSGEVEIVDGIAFIHYRLVDHPHVRSVKAQIEDRGNKGRATLLLADGTTSVRHW